MTRISASRIGIIAILALLAWQAQPAASTAAFFQESSDQAKSQLKERDRLWEESQMLRAQGKLAEAITAAQAMLAIQRIQMLAADHLHLAVTLGWLAQLNLEKEWTSWRPPPRRFKKHYKYGRSASARRTGR